MNIPSSIATLLVGILLTVVSLWYGQNHGLLPAQASKEAVQIDELFNLMMTIGTGLFLLVQGALIYSLFKFRRRPDDDTDGPYIEGNIPLEILWTAIPAVIVLIIGVYSFDVYNQIGGLDPMNHSAVAHGHSTHQMAQMPGAAIAAPLPDASNESDLDKSANATGTRSPEVAAEVTQDPATAAVRDESIPQRNDSSAMGSTAPRIGSTPDKAGQPAEYVINATGLQFAWLFTYPDTGIVAGELHVPVGKEILLNISANDVLHAFWVPEYRLKQDAIPGKQTELRFTPSKLGEYSVICAELCGAYHGVMKTKVIAQTQADFDTWVKEQQVANNPDQLDQAIATADQSPDQFLAPFVQNLGIDGTVVQQLHPDRVPASAS
ncbi:MAG: cytochrome c oxidase subunit II [Leptolyngbyaceae cyanobacterium bins.302]|nr:cytochrome c oxidase subunit II [Leptolyngbyaceae cyanobacterium bins.302]